MTYAEYGYGGPDFYMSPPPDPRLLRVVLLVLLVLAGVFALVGCAPYQTKRADAVERQFVVVGESYADAYHVVWAADGTWCRIERGGKPAPGDMVRCQWQAPSDQVNR